MTEFLRGRGLLRSAQLIMALVASSSALVPVTYLLIDRDQTPDRVAVGVSSTLFTVVMTCYWLSRWPSRHLSQAVALTGAVIIAAWSLVQPAPGVAGLALSAMAVTGAYLAFLHSPRALLTNAAVALIAAGVVASRLARDFDVATSVAAFWIIWFMNTTVPIAARGMARAMGIYATRADEDGFTGLLNRRAFGEAVAKMLAERPSGLSVLMVDIDEFKRINDTYGHAAGDAVILAVAEVLRRITPPGSVICRAGGEEFLIALSVRGVAASTAQDIRAAIADLPDGITASIGVVDAGESDPLAPDAVAGLIAGADAAMYRAKRGGGNAVAFG